MPARLSYFRRRMSERVRSAPPWPEPTGDVFAATLYRQRWVHRTTGARTEFWVLCFPDQQEDAGLHRMDADAATMRLEWSEPCVAPDVDALRAVLAVESEAEREMRRAEWKRLEDGPSEPDYGTVTLDEQHAAAHRAHREGRQ